MRSDLRAFVVDEVSGQVWTNEGMAKYSGGYFDVHAAAVSADDESHRTETRVRVSQGRVMGIWPAVENFIFS